LFFSSADLRVLNPILHVSLLTCPFGNIIFLETFLDFLFGGRAGLGVESKLGTVHFLSGGVGWWLLRGATRKNSDVKGGVTSGKFNFEGGHRNINEYIIYKNQSNKLSYSFIYKNSKLAK
jgi:hypothetical protein